MIEIEFSEVDIEQLHYERFHHPHPRVRQRAEAVYLKALGYAHQDICRIVRIMRIPMKSSTSSGDAVHLTQRSDAR